MNTEDKNTDRSTQTALKPRSEKTPAERVKPPVVYRLPGMDAVSVHSNLKYSDVDNPFLLMDVYRPPNRSKGDLRPIVALIHGGRGAQYKPKDWGIFQSWGRLIAAAGMVSVMFTHRLGYPKPLLAEAALDLRNAIDYIRANADAFGADPSRIALFAWSAGGPLLSIALQDRPQFIRCLVAFYAYLDIQRSPSHVENESADTLKAFSPIAHLERDASRIVPVFVARAGQDEIPMMNESIDGFVAAATAANVPLTYMNHPTGEHGFDNQNDDHRSREIIRSALAFLSTHLNVT